MKVKQELNEERNFLPLPLLNTFECLLVLFQIGRVLIAAEVSFFGGLPPITQKLVKCDKSRRFSSQFQPIKIEFICC